MCRWTSGFCHFSENCMVWPQGEFAGMSLLVKLAAVLNVFHLWVIFIAVERKFEINFNPSQTDGHQQLLIERTWLEKLKVCGSICNLVAEFFLRFNVKCPNSVSALVSVGSDLKTEHSQQEDRYRITKLSWENLRTSLYKPDWRICQQCHHDDPSHHLILASIQSTKPVQLMLHCILGCQILSQWTGCAFVDSCFTCDTRTGLCCEKSTSFRKLRVIKEVCGEVRWSFQEIILKQCYEFWGEESRTLWVWSPLRGGFYFHCEYSNVKLMDQSHWKYTPPGMSVILEARRRSNKNLNSRLTSSCKKQLCNHWNALTHVGMKNFALLVTIEKPFNNFKVFRLNKVPLILTRS